MWAEVVNQGTGFAVQDAVREAAAEGWLRVTPLESPSGQISVAGRRLHAGEIEVLRLGAQLRAGVLLMDDRRAVADARALGFRVAPTIAIYIQAKRLGLIQSVTEKVDRLRSSGFRLSQKDCRAVLAAAGEV